MYGIIIFFFWEATITTNLICPHYNSTLIYNLHEHFNDNWYGIYFHCIISAASPSIICKDSAFDQFTYTFVLIFYEWITNLKIIGFSEKETVFWARYLQYDIDYSIIYNFKNLDILQYSPCDRIKGILNMKWIRRVSHPLWLH